MPHSERNRLARAIFEGRYLCLIAPIAMDIALPAPTPPADEFYDGRNTAAGCTVTIDHSEEIYTLEALYGATPYTGHEASDNHLANTPVERYLSIDQMAEVLFVEGEFAFIDPRDVTRIREIVGDYLGVLDYGRKMYPHYKLPPEEDLKKLEFLTDIISPLADRVEACGEGTAEWDKLVSGLFVTGRVEGRLTARAREARLEAEAQAAPPVTVEGQYEARRQTKPDPFKF